MTKEISPTEEATILLESFFGKEEDDGGLEKYDFNDSLRSKGTPFFASKKRILNPSKNDYIFWRKWRRALSDAGLHHEPNFIKWNVIQIVIMAMELVIDPVKMEEWEGEPILQYLNQA